ncbi:1-acyl-sn-glycerol-3-phosphate acyltransferase [Aquincola sp. S2]|uniref:1-acyl-sn-glycerol-3-phosphate acyltransferase n=1 Tax=Pseudaquabacterium terrae TaxID=2732868 RepID=A0ABX2EJ93_9BURK|nr:lysophospholipid acyltransferase family protein [Aquabacterium terrae]NRF68688.1 1-acyl-sn-glycerol-3-phosphate acyltransferase [Aquabacterium terrae]
MKPLRSSLTAESSPQPRRIAWPVALPMTLLLYLLLLLLGLMSLSWNLVAMLLYPVLSRQRGQAIGRAAIAYVYRMFWAIAAFTGMLRLEAGLLDALRDEPGLVIAANHPSMLDALMLVARLPRATCIMKASLLRNPFLSAGARLARYVSNDAPLAMVRQAVDTLKQGGQLVMFPEGTRTTQPPVNPFMPGVTLIAKLAKAPIQTVFIDTDSPYLGKGWPLWRLPPLPIVFSVRIGERFEPQRDSDALLHELEAYFASGVRPNKSMSKTTGSSS